MKIDKGRLITSNNIPLTMGLFLEHKYDPNQAVYTLSEHDKMYDGRTFPSLKRLYLEHEDPTEYDFAITHLHSWKQWQRLCRNKEFQAHVEEWREELEVKIRSQAIRDIIDMTANEASFSAAKWLADRGWEKRGAGRPSKEEQEKRIRQDEKLANEFEADFERLRRVK